MIGSIYVRIVVFALSCSISAWIGYRVASGTYEERLKDISIAISESQNAAIIRHNQELEVERKRANEAQKARNAMAQKAQKVIDETSISTDSVWSDDQRMRIKQLYDIYGYTE